MIILTPFPCPLEREVLQTNPHPASENPPLPLALPHPEITLLHASPEINHHQEEGEVKINRLQGEEEEEEIGMVIETETETIKHKGEEREGIIEMEAIGMKGEAGMARGREEEIDHHRGGEGIVLR